MTIRKTTITILCGLAVSLTNCKEDEPTFVQGEVLFSLNDTTSYYDTYTLIDNLNLKIKEAHDFNYLIRTTTDSADTIELILQSKQYLTNGGQTFGALYLNDSLYIITNFFDLDSVEANDWINTVQQLTLIENLSGNFNKWGVLTVPFGQEQYWVNELKRYNIIKAASLNHIN